MTQRPQIVMLLCSGQHQTQRKHKTCFKVEVCQVAPKKHCSLKFEQEKALTVATVILSNLTSQLLQLFLRDFEGPNDGAVEHLY